MQNSFEILFGNYRKYLQVCDYKETLITSFFQQELISILYAILGSTLNNRINPDMQMAFFIRCLMKISV